MGTTAVVRLESTLALGHGTHSLFCVTVVDHRNPLRASRTGRHLRTGRRPRCCGHSWCGRLSGTGPYGVDRPPQSFRAERRVGDVRALARGPLTLKDEGQFTGSGALRKIRHASHACHLPACSPSRPSLRPRSSGARHRLFLRRNRHCVRAASHNPGHRPGHRPRTAGGVPGGNPGDAPPTLPGGRMSPRRGKHPDAVEQQSAAGQGTGCTVHTQLVDNFVRPRTFKVLFNPLTCRSDRFPQPPWGCPQQWSSLLTTQPEKLSTGVHKPVDAQATPPRGFPHPGGFPSGEPSVSPVYYFVGRVRERVDLRGHPGTGYSDMSRPRFTPLPIRRPSKGPTR